MTDRYSDICEQLRAQPKRWLVTGAAGFIGSNLVEKLLGLGQHVVGLDNFSTGYERNLDEIGLLVGTHASERFTFIEGDIRDLDTCNAAVRGCSIVLHQAALGSVPRSLDNPALTNSVNIDGFLNMLIAARDSNVERFVYAASSSTYGDHPALPKVEDRIGRPLSPYAVTKYVNELYADVFARAYGIKCAGLRYFNVFGPRQDPQGAYAAVIPTWTAAMLTGDEIFINGDGETSRDFCFVANAVQANLLAATGDEHSLNQVYNIAVGECTSLNQLVEEIGAALSAMQVNVDARPTYRDFRPGDVRHSQADVSKARKLIGYSPSHTVKQGLAAAMPWYRDFFRQLNDREVGEAGG